MFSSPPKEISHPLAVPPHPAQLPAIWGFLMKDLFFFFNERTQKFSADPQRTSPQARPTGISLEDEGPAPTRGQRLWRRLCKEHASSPEEGSAVLCSVTQSCLTLCDPMDCSPPGSSVHGDSPGQNTGVGCHALLQGIFLTQGSNPGLPHCRQILYQLSH